MGNVSLKVLEFFVQKRVRTLKYVILWNFGGRIVAVSKPFCIKKKKEKKPGRSKIKCFDYPIQIIMKTAVIA